MLRRSMAWKLIGLSFVGCAASVLAALSVWEGTASLSKRQTAAGEVVRSSRERHVEMYFTIILGQVLTFFEDHVITEATAGLSAAFKPNGQLINLDKPSAQRMVPAMLCG